MNAEKQAEYLQLIADGSGRLEAAQKVDPKNPRTVLDALDADAELRETVEILERAHVDDALLSAASSGNLPAMQAFYSRRRPTTKKAPTGPFAEVRRMAESLGPLLKSPD